MIAPKLTPPWWAEALVLVGLFAFAVWLTHAEPEPHYRPAWMAALHHPP